MNLSFQCGDIVLSAPGYTAACYCILEVVPFRPQQPYTGLNLVNLKKYRLPDNGLTKVGTASEEFLKAQTTPESGNQPREDPAQELRYRRGQMRAAREAWHATGAERERWLILASAKPGDNICMQFECGHAMAQTYKFRYVLERGSKFVFVAENAKGNLTKLSLEMVALEQPAVKLLANAAPSGETPT
jgi:hypothetical protein